MSADDFSERTKAELRRLFSPGNATDDSLMLGNGSTWDIKAVPDCTTGALQFTAATNTFSCGSAGVTGSGTANNIAKWVAPGTALGDSGITDTSTGVVPAAFTSTTVAVGGFTSATPGATTYKGVGASGADTAGGATTLASGPGTGTGAPGAFTIQVAPNSTTGSVANTPKTVFTAGGTSFALGNVIINSGGTAPADSLVQGYNSAGTDVSGGGLSLASGTGTGTKGGAIRLYSSVRAVGTGSGASGLQAFLVADGALGNFILGGQAWPFTTAPGQSFLRGGYSTSGVADSVGGDIIVQGGRGTGTGAGGQVLIQVVPSAATGNTLNIVATAATFTRNFFSIGPWTTISGGVAPAASLIQGVGAAGTDIAGGALTLGTGQGTGSAAAPAFTIQVAPNAGTGSSQNALKTVFTADGTKFELGNTTKNSGGAALGNSFVYGYNAAGTDVAGGNLYLGSGQGTGTGGGTLYAYVSVPNASTGTGASARQLWMQAGGSSGAGVFTLGGLSWTPAATAPTFNLAGVHATAGNTDQAGGAVNFNSGRGTGAGVGGAFTITVTPNAGTGTTLNATRAALTLNHNSFTLGNWTTNSGGTAPVASTLGGVNSAGSDVAGGSLVVQSGAGTGLAAGSTITLKTPAVGSTGTTPETLTTRMTLDTVGAVMPAGQWLRQAASRSMLAANYTNATASMTNTALSITLLAGRKYTFRMSLFLADSQAAEGVLVDFDGGAATATNFRAHAILHDTALLLSQQVSALATDIGVATVTGDSLMEVTGSIEVNAAGTLIVRASQNSHTSGTLTIYRGSHIEFEDVTGS